MSEPIDPRDPQVPMADNTLDALVRSSLRRTFPPTFFSDPTGFVRLVTERAARSPCFDDLEVDDRGYSVPEPLAGGFTPDRIQAAVAKARTAVGLLESVTNARGVTDDAFRRVIALPRVVELELLIAIAECVRDAPPPISSDLPGAPDSLTGTGPGDAGLSGWTDAELAGATAAAGCTWSDLDLAEASRVLRLADPTLGGMYNLYVYTARTAEELAELYDTTPDRIHHLLAEAKRYVREEAVSAARAKATSRPAVTA